MSFGLCRRTMPNWSARSSVWPAAGQDRRAVCAARCGSGAGCVPDAVLAGGSGAQAG
jgi:hypothetical protein